MRSVTSPGPIEAPRPAQLIGEARILLDVPRLAWNLPSLMHEPRGSGEPVMLLPGVGAGDRAMFPLRAYLRAMRYRAVGWGLGRNSGKVHRLLPLVVARIGDLAGAAGQPLRLVGWSLGGYLAREAAREQPAAVERIVTLGSPVLGGPKHTVMAGRYRRLGFDVDRIAAEVEARYGIPLRVPVTAIYSRSDRIVAWRACIDPYSPNVEHIEVTCGHLGMGVSAEVYRLVARALAGERGRDSTSDPPTARESAKENQEWSPPSSG